MQLYIGFSTLYQYPKREMRPIEVFELKSGIQEFDCFGLTGYSVKIASMFELNKQLVTIDFNRIPGLFAYYGSIVDGMTYPTNGLPRAVNDVVIEKILERHKDSIHPETAAFYKAGGFKCESI